MLAFCSLRDDIFGKSWVHGLWRRSSIPAAFSASGLTAVGVELTHDGKRKPILIAAHGIKGLRGQVTIKKKDMEKFFRVGVEFFIWLPSHSREKFKFFSSSGNVIVIFRAPHA